MTCTTDDQTAPWRADADGHRSVFAALAEVLDQLAGVVAGLSDRSYAGADETGGGSIGGHVRHCLDHVRLLLEGLDTGIVDYDRRERGTDIERDRRAACEKVQELVRRLRAAGDVRLDRALRVRSLLDDGGPSLEAPSSVGRELLFVLSHTIHHNAMIASAARRLGNPVPAFFGYAPGTIAHQKRAGASLRS
jgi:uncharacterized damage-inducible protein DinB